MYQFSKSSEEKNKRFIVSDYFYSNSCGYMADCGIQFCTKWKRKSVPIHRNDF